MERFVFFSNFSVCLFFFGETKEQTQEEKMALTVDCREASFWEPTFNELKEMVEEVPSFGSSTPLQQCVYIMWGVAFLCWLVSVLMHNYSQVDRLWSILPPLYVIVFCVADGGNSERLMLWGVCTSAWGIRLSYNFYRKGGYNPHDEDYRWPELRKRINPIMYQIFNVFFIAIYQNILLLLLALPMQVCYLSTKLCSSSQTMVVMDYVGIALFILLLLGESVADQQQWRFQSKKYELKGKGAKLTGDYAKGFLTSGLFRYSRHPNFFCEISIWWAVYLSSVAASGAWLNWSVLGAFLLFLLFQGSTQFTEEITSRKYPEYRRYQRTTSRLIPMFPGRG